MTRTIFIGAAGLALALGGCSERGETPSRNELVGQSNTTELAGTVESGDPDSIPVLLRGEWGMTPNDCDDSRGDAKGRLEIDAGSLRFYESTATLAEIGEASDNRIVATFEFSGEGQQWTRQIMLEAEEDGQSLVRRDLDDETMQGSLSYNRCTA